MIYKPISDNKTCRLLNVFQATDLKEAEEEEEQEEEDEEEEEGGAHLE